MKLNAKARREVDKVFKRKQEIKMLQIEQETEEKHIVCLAKCNDEIKGHVCSGMCKLKNKPITSPEDTLQDSAEKDAITFH